MHQPRSCEIISKNAPSASLPLPFPSRQVQHLTCVLRSSPLVKASSSIVSANFWSNPHFPRIQIRRRTPKARPGVEERNKVAQVDKCGTQFKCFVRYRNSRGWRLASWKQLKTKSGMVVYQKAIGGRKLRHHACAAAIGGSANTLGYVARMTWLLPPKPPAASASHRLSVFHPQLPLANSSENVGFTEHLRSLAHALFYAARPRSPAAVPVPSPEPAPAQAGAPPVSSLPAAGRPPSWRSPPAGTGLTPLPSAFCSTGVKKGYVEAVNMWLSGVWRR